MTQTWQEFIDQFPISTPSSKILVDLSHFGIIKVSGPDAAKFLQGQLTCDINALNAGAHSLGAYCDIKGRVESLFRIWRVGEDYYLRMTAGLVASTLQELQKYAAFSKVELQDVSVRFAGFGIYNHKVDLNILDPQLGILEITPQQRYEIFGPIKALEKAWHECIKHATHVDPEMWEVLDINAGLPELYPETKSEFFAHDLNLAALNAISFTKGCYRGQEIIARMQNRGNLKRHLHKFSAEQNNIKPGDVVTAGGPEQETVAGTVVRCCIDHDGKTIGLAVITDTFVKQELYVANIALKI